MILRSIVMTQDFTRVSSGNSNPPESPPCSAWVPPPVLTPSNLSYFLYICNVAPLMAAFTQVSHPTSGSPLYGVSLEHHTSLEWGPESLSWNASSTSHGDILGFWGLKMFSSSLGRTKVTISIVWLLSERWKLGIPFWHASILQPSPLNHIWNTLYHWAGHCFSHTCWLWD